jgi:hypothetical protein
VGAGGDDLGDVAGVAQAAVGDQRHAGAGQGLVTSATAVICGTPTPATMRVVQMEPGADTDLDRIGAGLHQCPGGVAGGDVAADDLHVGEVRP